MNFAEMLKIAHEREPDEDYTTQPSHWRVVFQYCNGARTTRYAYGFLPLLQAVRDGRAISGVRKIEVGPKIGPALTIFSVTE